MYSYVEVMKVFLGHVYDFFFLDFFSGSSLVNSFLKNLVFLHRRLQ